MKYAIHVVLLVAAVTVSLVAQESKMQPPSGMFMTGKLEDGKVLTSAGAEYK